MGSATKRTAALALALPALWAAAQESGPPPSFSRDILPILSDKCFVCHGPDTRKEGFLRLDSREAATADRGGYRAIDPGRPERSEILARLFHPEDPMPPRDAEKQLAPREREILARWVRQGGEYERHWAFVPPQRPPLPSVDLGDSPVDAFVGRALARAGAGFAPEASREILARRSSLVLTGLPPDPVRLEAFLRDGSPQAWERWIEFLLASPSFGEHQARYWLDAVRYGDTHGLHLDNRRGIYPYRDWVVEAFNRNLPLDDFVAWQLAGDLLPDPSLRQQLATGYVRMNPTTSEGGAIPMEFQAKNTFDRTENFGTVFLGMTLACARCHTHKYDPITHQEYYRLAAFFNSTAEGALDGNAYSYGPVVQVPERPSLWSRWEEFREERSLLLERSGMDQAAGEEELLGHAAARSGWKADGWKRSRPVPPGGDPPSTWQPAPELPGRVEAGSLPGPGERIWIGFDVETPREQALWLSLVSEAPARVRVDGEELALSPLGGPFPAVLPLELPAGSSRVLLQLSGPDAEAGISSPWDEVARAKGLGSDPSLRLRLLADPAGPFARLPGSGRARELVMEEAWTSPLLTTSLVARQLPEPRSTRVLERGEYDLPKGEPLEPGVPSVLGPLPPGAPADRLGLARWLTAREHPLAARVLVNRIWQRTFGQGLVRTPEDFGLQGRQPTHPELLDWLAAELHDSGWDLRHMLRLMVRSRTFRQSSRWRPEVDDPENRLLARGPHFRLDAETLRDLGLHASGLLDSRMGGAGTRPPQPEGMWQALSHPASNTKRYVPDQGSRLYRRSLYTYWKRTSPHPMMTLFDAPSRESSCVARSRTSTPLQSLGLLNEDQRLEMGRALALRLLRERETEAGRLDLLMRLVSSQAPSGSQQEACLELLGRMKESYRRDPGDARRLAGELPRPLDPVLVAAWTQVAMVALASDAAILIY